MLGSQRRTFYYPPSKSRSFPPSPLVRFQGTSATRLAFSPFSSSETLLFLDDRLQQRTRRTLWPVSKQRLGMVQKESNRVSFQNFPRSLASPRVLLPSFFRFLRRTLASSRWRSRNFGRQESNWKGHTNELFSGLLRRLRVICA